MKMDLGKRFDAILYSLKLDATCVLVTELEDSIFYDVSLGIKTSTKKFIAQIDEIAFRLRSEFKLRYEVLSEKGIIRIHYIKSFDSTYEFFDSYVVGSGYLPFYLGRDYYGNNITVDWAGNPHTILAGTTGSGKSTALHGFIANTLSLPNTELYLGDPKNVEFSPYKSLDKVSYIANTYMQHLHMLDSLIDIMNQRFALLKCMGKVNINQASGFTRIVVIIDEIADLIMQDRSKKFQFDLARLTQMCRAAGIYFIIATQRPSVNILSGTIKANFPARIACKVSSRVDSKVILDELGAEALVGKGDAIIRNYSHNVRFRFPFVAAEEILARFSPATNRMRQLDNAQIQN